MQEKTLCLCCKHTYLLVSMLLAMYAENNSLEDTGEFHQKNEKYV